MSRPARRSTKAYFENLQLGVQIAETEWVVKKRLKELQDGRAEEERAAERHQPLACGGNNSAKRPRARSPVGPGTASSGNSRARASPSRSLKNGMNS